MKPIRYFCLFFLVILTMSNSCKENDPLSKDPVSSEKESEATSFLQPLAGADELGRVLPAHDEVGNIKDNRTVGIFYFLWQGDDASKTSELKWDLTKIVSNHPEVLKDGDHENWGSRDRGRYYFWGEPIYGYYRGDDYWVHLRNMQLLTEAQVDFLVIDATNTLIYEEQSEALMKAIRTLQKQGLNPPKMVYYTNTESGKTMQNIYDTYYRLGSPIRHPETWYHLEGKPLILGRTKEAQGSNYQSFFTFREAQWPNEPIQKNGWPWIDFVRPQHVYENLNGEREIINVSVSQHPNPAAGMGGSAFYGNKDNWGRSYRNGNMGDPEKDIVYGYNFQEQWDYALQQDVPFIFITGWNEWIAGRWGSTDGDPEHSYFCDQADPEYSRDIEPTMTAGLKDNYYMQMVANIRRYKGMNAFLKADKENSIKVWNDWEEVEPVYTDYQGDTEKRDHPGAVLNPPNHYVNTTGRNDFATLKVARDKNEIFFLAETVNPIIVENDQQWMRLYLNSDRDYSTGWNGYDLRISGGKELQRYSGGGWETIATVTVKTEGRRLMYSFPLELISGQNRALNFEFKWSDNMQKEDPMDWYLNGDVAPEGRFNYVYQTE
ncbi:MAG: hypothetical protein JJE08_08985 [Proteiniphilum sp.]|nr:hypothetical protein [Proteiniphilum sp.]